MNDIDYKVVTEIAESFKNKEKVEILGISVGEERQVKQAIKNLIQRNKELEEEKVVQRHQLNSAFDNGFIHKDLVRELIEYEVIDISGFKCIPVVALQDLLNNKTS